MPFVLREESDTTNPTLATVYGKQITAGNTVYYIKEGRSKSIIILGEGEMDGLDVVYYNGEILPEFSTTNPNDRNWKFHPGTVTKQPSAFFDVTAISGDTLTLSTPFGSTYASITETITATGGTRTFSYLGQTTATVPHNANAATIQASLEALSTVSTGAIIVTGAGPFTYTFSTPESGNSNNLIINTGSLTGGTASFNRPSEVALVAGVDPETSPYPVGVKQNQKLYVVYSVGNSIKLSFTPGGSPITGWTTGSYLINNLRVYKADGGFFDPVQGRPEFFPTVDFTLSRIAYIEVNLPSEMSEIEDGEPTKFKFFVRGRRLQNFDSTGALANSLGVAYVGLPAQTKFFSANNALVILDIMLNYMKISPSRIDWPSFVAYRNHCDESIVWNSGNIKVLGNPTFTFINSSAPIIGTIVRSGGAAGTWDSGALSVQSTTLISSIAASGVYRGGHGAIGLTRATSGYTSPTHASNLYSIEVGNPDGKIKIYSGASVIYNETLPYINGDSFKVDVSDNTVNFFKNSSLIHTENASFGAGTTKAYCSLNTAESSFSDVKFFPVTGVNRVVNRFDAHVVFAGETESSSAMQQIMARSPSCHWQDVNGKIKFIVGTTYKDITWGETALAGNRVLSEVLSYDTTGSAYPVPTGATINAALGGGAIVDSIETAGHGAAQVLDGLRFPNGTWGTSGGWASGTPTASESTPAWIEVTFTEKRYINKISLFTLGDAVSYASVSPSDTFTVFGIQNFTVEYWNGTSWTIIESFIDNNKVWVDCVFPLINTNKIRVNITKAGDGIARLVEVEAWGPETIQSVVARSNIVSNSFASYKTPPENKANFLRVELRDLDDPFLTKKFIFIDRDELRDQVDMLIDLGILQMGVCSQSLADRMGESVMRWATDLDLFINVKGMASTYALSKGDIVRFAHPVTGWTLDSPVEFIVLEETIEPGSDTADEKTYLLQSYSPDVYNDTKHGAITANFPIVTSPLTPPPPVTQLELTEETRTLPDGTSYSVILGVVHFDISYPYTQRARIQWKKALDVDFTTTNIILEQPNTGITSIPFELNFATIGINKVKAITETISGVVSANSVIGSIDISGTAQIEEVSWEQFVNTDLLGSYLIKVAGASGFDASAKSTKALAYGDGYLQFTYDSESRYAIGFNNYNLTNNTQVMKYGLDIVFDSPPQLIINGSTVAANVNAQEIVVGHSFKIEVIGSIVNFYQIIDNVYILIGTTTNLQVYPLYVDSSIYTIAESVPPVQLYGRLEPTTGLKVHWESVRSMSITSDVNGIETLTKSQGGHGWSTPDSAGTFSTERILNNGSLEWVATETTTYRLAGLSILDAEVATPDIAGYLGIAYAMYTEISGTLSIREFGTVKHTTTYIAGDIFRIERINGQVRYRKNGALLYTSLSNTSLPLYVDTSFYSISSTLKDFRIKRVGAFTAVSYPYPIYLMQSLDLISNRPQDDGSTYFELSGNFSTIEEAPIQSAKVKVFNKFGTLVADFPPFTYSGIGFIGQGFHDRKYADPYEEAIYEVRLDNGNGMSGAVFVKGNGATPPVFNESFVMPVLINPVNVVQDMICSPIDHNRVSINWTYNASIDIYYRLADQAWAIIASGSNVSTKPFTAVELLPNTYYEFKAAPTGTTTNWSNICRTKTLQAPLPADTSPPPLSLVGSLNSVNPSTSVDLSWNRNSTTNTGVKIYKNGSLIYTGASAVEVSKTITGLSASTTYDFKVKNIYGGGDSIDSNVVSITTANSDSVLKPSGLAAVANSHNRITLTWTNNTASNNIQIERSLDGITGWSVISTVAATISNFINTGLEAETNYYYRVKNTGVTGYSNVAVATTWIYISPGGCILPSTLIWTWDGNKLIQIRAGDVRPGDTLVTVVKGGYLAKNKVKQVFNGVSDSINIIITEEGKMLECTPSHPLINSFACDIIKSHEVYIGDELLVVNDSVDKTYLDVVKSKETLYGEFKIVIFEMEGDEHTFISNGIVSHNTSQK